MLEIFPVDVFGNEGPVVSNIKSGTWVERYLDGGSFEITTDDETVLETLDIDTTVSHTKSHELMIVETHEINETRSGELTIKISGRSIEQVLMENRLLTKRIPGYPSGAVFVFDKISEDGKNYVANDVTADWFLAKLMIEDYLVNGVEHPAQEVPNLTVYSDYNEYLFTTLSKDYNFNNLDTVYSAVKELLATADLGIETRRPNFITPTTDFRIYYGPSINLKLYWELGQLEEARYLRSSTTEKTALIVYDGDHTSRHYTPGPDGNSGSGITCREEKYDMSYLDADWDAFSPLSSNATFVDWIHRKHRNKALDVLKDLKSTEIMDVKISEKANLEYNVDYRMGDKIEVIGRFGFKDYLRVTEHAFTWDENGLKDYPTLTRLPDTSITWV